MQAVPIEGIALQQRVIVDVPMGWIWKMCDESAKVMMAAASDAVTPEVVTDDVPFQADRASDDR
jgi:hypothetical protein